MPVSLRMLVTALQLPEPMAPDGERRKYQRKGAACYGEVELAEPAYQRKLCGDDHRYETHTMGNHACRAGSGMFAVRSVRRGHSGDDTTESRGGGIQRPAERFSIGEAHRV